MPPYDYSSIFNSFGSGASQPTGPSMGSGIFGLGAPQMQDPSALFAGGTSMPDSYWAKNGQQGGADGSSWFGKDGRLGTIFGGVQALGGLYMGLQQLSQAKDALNFQKKAYGTNLANSVKTYNTSLEDRINGRTSDYAGKQQDVQAYLDSHKLKA